MADVLARSDGGKFPGELVDARLPRLFLAGAAFLNGTFARGMMHVFLRTEWD
jgi:hypothetical protein